jgi:hypothetical protein
MYEFEPQSHISPFYSVSTHMHRHRTDAVFSVFNVFGPFLDQYPKHTKERERDAIISFPFEPYVLSFLSSFPSNLYPTRNFFKVEMAKRIHIL